MFQTLRIVFTILSALCVLAVMPVGAFVGLPYALICVAAAFVFYVVMLYFKTKQEQSNLENAPPTPDFFSTPSDSEQKVSENEQKSGKIDK